MARRSSEKMMFLVVLMVGFAQGACHRNAPRDGAPGALANQVEQGPATPGQVIPSEDLLHPPSFAGSATDLEPNKNTHALDLKGELPSLMSLKASLHHWNQQLVLQNLNSEPSVVGLGDGLMIRLTKMKFVAQKGRLSAELCTGSLQTYLGGELVACQNTELTKISDVFLKEATEKEKSLVFLDQVWLNLIVSSKLSELNQAGAAAEAVSLKMMQPAPATELAADLQKLKIPTKLKAE